MLWVRNLTFGHCSPLSCCSRKIPGPLTWASKVKILAKSDSWVSICRVNGSRVVKVLFSPFLNLDYEEKIFVEDLLGLSYLVWVLKGLVNSVFLCLCLVSLLSSCYMSWELGLCDEIIFSLASTIWKVHLQGCTLLASQTDWEFWATVSNRTEA